MMREGSIPVPLAGEITEVVGTLSSGRTSLLLRWLAAVTRAGAPAALVDTDDAFDPVSAARAGVDLRRLLWVRGNGRRMRALRAVDVLVRRPGFALIALDTGESPVPLTLQSAFRLKLAVRRTQTALVILGCRRVAGAGAGLAVETVQDGVEWTGPDARATRLQGMRTRLHVLRSRGARCAHARAGSSVLRWSA